MIAETLDTIPPLFAFGFKAYGAEPVPLPVEVRPDVPEVWFVHTLYEQLSSTNSTANNGGRMQVTFTTAGNTLAVQIGDVLQYGSVQASIRQVVSNSPLVVVLDEPFASLTNQTAWVAYLNRRDRLTAMTVSSPTGESYEPLTIGQVFNDGPVSSGSVSTCYYYNAGAFAQTQFKKPARPVNDDVANLPVGYGGIDSITVAMGLIGEAPASVSIPISNRTTITTAFYNNLLANEQIQIPIWQEARFGCVQAPFMAASESSITYQPFDDPSYPRISWRVAARRKYVCWYTRYGAPQVLPFSWLNQEGLATNAIAPFRIGNTTRNIGMRATRSLTLTTGLVNRKYNDWWEDLATSPYVFVADAIEVRTTNGVTIVDIDRTQWTEYVIQPGTYQLGNASNDLVNLTFDLVQAEELLTYRN